jgi:YebC/PmpR family DNA-binding regulatory protein
MPKANVDRAIERAASSSDADNFHEIRYEGYGPGGVALIVDTLTDNRNRTVGEVRHLFSKYNGNLGPNGCVAYLFDRKGVLEFDCEATDGDALIEAAMEADAEDVLEDGDTIRVHTTPEGFEGVKQALEQAGFTAATADIQLLPQSTVSLAGKAAQTMLKLYELLDEHEDVGHVWANFDISEQELLEAAKAG